MIAPIHEHRDHPLDQRGFPQPRLTQHERRRITDQFVVNHEIGSAHTRARRRIHAQWSADQFHPEPAMKGQ